MAFLTEMNVAARFPGRDKVAGFMAGGLITGIFLLATVLPASARPDVRKMTCSQAQSLVKSSGAIVLTFTQYTYDRVVKNNHYCDYGSRRLEDVIKKTLDDDKCLIGSICVIPLDRDRKDKDEFIIIN